LVGKIARRVHERGDQRVCFDGLRVLMAPRPCRQHRPMPKKRPSKLRLTPIATTRQGASQSSPSKWSLLCQKHLLRGRRVRHPQTPAQPLGHRGEAHKSSASTRSAQLVGEASNAWDKSAAKQTDGALVGPTVAARPSPSQLCCLRSSTDSRMRGPDEPALDGRPIAPAPYRSPERKIDASAASREALPSKRRHNGGRDSGEPKP